MSAVGGVTVTTSAEVTDYTALGAYVAQANSDEQAAFLAGLAVAFAQFEPIALGGLMQIEYIRAEVDAHNERTAVAWFIEELNARLNPSDVTR